VNAHRSRQRTFARVATYVPRAAPTGEHPRAALRIPVVRRGGHRAAGRVPAGRRWGRIDLADETSAKIQQRTAVRFRRLAAPQLNPKPASARALTAGVGDTRSSTGCFSAAICRRIRREFLRRIPVEVGEEIAQGHAVRCASRRASRLYRLGASYLKEQNAGDDAREEAGSDLFFARCRRRGHGHLLLQSDRREGPSRLPSRPRSIAKRIG